MSITKEVKSTFQSQIKYTGIELCFSWSDFEEKDSAMHYSTLDKEIEEAAKEILGQDVRKTFGYSFPSVDNSYSTGDEDNDAFVEGKLPHSDDRIYCRKYEMKFMELEVRTTPGHHEVFDTNPREIIPLPKKGPYVPPAIFLDFKIEGYEGQAPGIYNAFAKAIHDVVMQDHKKTYEALKKSSCIADTVEAM